VPAAALRFFPTTDQVHPEDRHHLDALPTTSAESGSQRTAGEKAELSRKRQHRLVWVQDGDLLRAVPVTLGLIENQFAELVEGELTEGQAVVTGTEGAYSPR
jgi:HlyD family secretion protein